MNREYLLGVTFMTEFVPCTNHRPNRIRVVCERDSSTTWRRLYSWPLEAESEEEAHRICALRLAKEHNPEWRIVARGCTAKGYAWIMNTHG